MIQVHPIADAAGKVVPHILVLHHLLAAGFVVFINRNLFPDIFLGDAQGFFNGNLDGQSVGVPAGFAVHQETLHGFVTAENILDGTGHNMVNAGSSVGRGRSFVKNVGTALFADFQTLLKHIFFFPPVQHFLADGGEVKLLVFRIFLH